MPEDEVAASTDDARNREIFLALVEAQDQNMSVAQSRKLIAERFTISEGEVRRIEAAKGSTTAGLRCKGQHASPPRKQGTALTPHPRWRCGIVCCNVQHVSSGSQ